MGAVFDKNLVPIAWFDAEMQALGWFTYELLAAPATTPDIENPEFLLMMMMMM